MGASVQPETQGERIRRVVAALRAQGAPEHDIETYLTQHEGLRPEPAMAPSDATAQTTGPAHGDLAGRVIGGVLNTATQLVTHPIQSAESMVTAPLKSARDAFLTPTTGERVSDATEGFAAKAGLAIPSGTPYERTISPHDQHVAQLQTIANVAAPAIAKGVSTGARALGVGRGLANAAGVSAIGATTGAAYSPDDPVAGGMTGAIMAPALVGLLKVPGKVGSAVLDRTALRPATTPGVVPEAAPIARNDPATAAKALRAGSDPALADPENRAVLERPGFIRLSNRPGAGGVMRTGPFIQGDQPQGVLALRPTRGGVQQTGPFPGDPRAGHAALSAGASRPEGIPPEIPQAAQGAEALQRLGVGRVVEPGQRGMGSAGYVISGATRIFEPLGRAVPEIAGFDTRARAAILRALEDKGLTPDDAKAELARRISAGEKPETIMELAGRPGARLGRTMRAASPKAGDVIDTRLENRALGAPQRAIDDALETSGLQQRSSGFQTTQQLIDQRAKDATKGYGETFQDETPINDERITKILSTPAGKRAWKRAVTMMKNDGVKVPQGKQNTEVEIPGGKGLQSATVKVPMNVDTPTIQQLHYLKLALDDMARPGMDRGAGQGGLGFNEARSISGVKGKLLEVMDEASPAYKAAREQYAESSSLKDANELGRKLWKMHPEEAAHEYANLGSEAEKAVFRRAGMDALADRLENGPEDVAKGAKKPRDLARIRLLFPDDATFQQFKDRIAREAEMEKTYGTASKGSQTADKLNDLAGMMDLPVSKLTPRRIVNAALTARGKLSSRRIAEAGAPMLTATGPELQALLDRLAQDYQTGKAGGARRTAITRAFATGVGSTSGRRP